MQSVCLDKIIKSRNKNFRYQATFTLKEFEMSKTEKVHHNYNKRKGLLFGKTRDLYNLRKDLKYKKEIPILSSTKIERVYFGKCNKSYFVTDKNEDKRLTYYKEHFKGLLNEQQDGPYKALELFKSRVFLEWFILNDSSDISKNITNYKKVIQKLYSKKLTVLSPVFLMESNNFHQYKNKMKRVGLPSMISFVGGSHFE